MSTAADYNAAKADTEKRKKVADAKLKKKAEEDAIAIIQNDKINPLKTEIEKQEAGKEYYRNLYQQYYDANKNKPGYPTATDTKVLAGYEAEMKKYQEVIDTKNRELNKWGQAIYEKRRKIAEYEKIINPPKVQDPKGSGNSSSSNAPRGEKIIFSADYKYNAPMVRSAYFGSPSFQSSILEGNFVDAGKYGDARNSWKGTTGGRGTIQMDEKFLSAFTSTTTSPDKVKIDTQKYGFKFLYNPQTVQMAWGLLNYMSPPYEATAQDPFQVISAGLMASVVSFELLLNRIEDFKFIDENGLSNNTWNNALDKENAILSLENVQDPALRQRILDSFTSPSFPYPEIVTNDELKEIYKKGTMYDLEYLLKTLNGPDGTFTSKLNGDTADRGWLRPTIVELHLGTSLRYRVRLSEFSVNHIIFNPRMVPILSSVKLTCNRYADGPEVDYYGPAKN